nr:hypothetical protein [Enterocloster clostridioformis]
MKINTQKFTDRSENTYEVHEATTNLGLTVTLSPLGASIQKIAIRTDQGEDLSMALSLPDPTVRPADAGYAGATLGPNTGRIRGSELPIGKQIYHLTPNEGCHQLHGGPHNLSTIIWATDSVTCTHYYVKIQFSSIPAGPYGWVSGKPDLSGRLYPG